MLLHPVIFYNGTCAAPGRRWREHTAVIPQVVREKLREAGGFSSWKDTSAFAFTESNSFSIIFLQTAGGEYEYEFGLHQSLSHHLLSAHANITLHLICLSGLC